MTEKETFENWRDSMVPVISEERLEAVKAQAVIRLVDDDASVRDALQCVFEIEGWQVETYASAEQYLTQESPSRPGAVVMDIRMPGRSGLEVQAQMIERGWTVPLIFLTGHGEVDMAVMALRRGAVDFFQKPVDNERLLQTVAVAADASLRSLALPETSANIEPGTPCSEDEWRRRWETLTDKERSVAHLVAQGCTNRQCAERLGNAVRTVEVHRANVLRKLGVRTPDEIASVIATVE